MAVFGSKFIFLLAFLGYAAFFMPSPAQAWFYKVHEIISLRKQVRDEYRSIFPDETLILKINHLNVEDYNHLYRLIKTQSLDNQVFLIENMFNLADHPWLMIRTASNTPKIKSQLSPLVGSDWLQFNLLNNEDRNQIFLSYFHSTDLRDLSYKVHIHLENEDELISVAKKFSFSNEDFAEVYESLKKSFNPVSQSIPLESILPAREQSIVHSLSSRRDSNCHGTAFCFGRQTTFNVFEAETLLNLKLNYEEIKNWSDVRYRDHIIFFNHVGLPEHSVIYLDGGYVFNRYGKGIGAPHSIFSMHHLQSLLTSHETNLKIFRQKRATTHHVRIPFLGEFLFYFGYTAAQVAQSVFNFCGSLVLQK